MVNILVCSKVESMTNEEIVCLNLNDAHLNLMTVGSLLDSILDKYKLNKLDSYQLICYGRKLKLERNISHYGIRSNTLVYLFKNPSAKKGNTGEKKDDKDSSENKEKKTKFDPKYIRNMILASKTALMNPEFHKILKNLSDSGIQENLMQCSPELRNDPTAIAILQDPELFAQIMSSDKIEEILEKHPAILEAATYLAAAFHEDVQSKMTTPNYHLDLSEMEEIMGGGVDAPPPDGLRVMSPTSAPSFAQLIQSQNVDVARFLRSQDLDSAQPSTSQNSDTVQSPVQGPSNPSAQNYRITSDMIRQAIENVSLYFENTPSNSNTGSNPVANTANDASPGQSVQSETATQRPDMSVQLQQMRDLGIDDVQLCLNALYATDGDVQAAVNLIFSESNRQ